MSFKLTKEQLEKLCPSSFTPLSRSRSSSRSRSRSRDRGLRVGSKSGGKRVSGAQARARRMRTIMGRDGVHRMSKTVGALEAKRKEVTMAKAGYFNDSKDQKVDLKSLTNEVDLLTKELELATTAIRAGLGDKPIRMRLSSTYTLTATVTTGIVNTVKTILPSDATEWSTCAALFDEYKILGGEVDFHYKNMVTMGGSGAVDTNAYPVIAYDADDTNSATSSLALTQFAQHKVFANHAFADSAGATVFVAGVSSRYRFRYHIPKGTVTQGGSSLQPGTEWCVTASPLAAGTIKFYHAGNQTAAVSVTAGVMYYDLEFRCRS